MKKVKFITLLVLFPFLTGAIFINGNGDEKTNTKKTTSNTVAFVKRIVKDVTYRKTSEESDWEIAKTGTLLEDGGEVKTGAKSLALVLFTDGSGLLRVRENSVLHIYGTKKEKTMDKNTFIQKGLIGFEVNKQSAAEEFKFTTPTVVASIRGTDGYLDYGEDSTFTMYLNSGSAGLTGSSGCDSLSAGSTIVVSSNGQCNMGQANQNNLNTYNSTKNIIEKKIKIKTNKGVVEIKYYGQSN